MTTTQTAYERPADAPPPNLRFPGFALVRRKQPKKAYANGLIYVPPTADGGLRTQHNRQIIGTIVQTDDVPDALATRLRPGVNAIFRRYGAAKELPGWPAYVLVPYADFEATVEGATE